MMTEERNPEQKKKTVQVKLVRHKWPDEIAAEKALRSYFLGSAMPAMR